MDPRNVHMLQYLAQNDNLVNATMKGTKTGSILKRTLFSSTINNQRRIMPMNSLDAPFAKLIPLRFSSEGLPSFL